MPLTIPYKGIDCCPGNLLVTIEGDKTYSNIIRGGARFIRELHYLCYVHKGFANFAPTKKNSHYKQGMMLVVKLHDIVDPEYKHKVINLLNNGYLNQNDDLWHKLYDTEDLTEFLR